MCTHNFGDEGRTEFNFVGQQKLAESHYLRHLVAAVANSIIN